MFTLEEKQPQVEPGKPAAPGTFPAGTLFVAVSDGDAVYAGEDGGPQAGGIGRWRVGRCGAWNSSKALPLAYRDPETGLIHSGWLEVVTESIPKPDGSRQATASEKRYAPHHIVDRRSRATSAAAGFAEPVTEPTPAAKKRAGGKGDVLSGAVRTEKQSPRMG